MTVFKKSRQTIYLFIYLYLFVCFKKIIFVTYFRVRRIFHACASGGIFKTRLKFNLHQAIGAKTLTRNLVKKTWTTHISISIPINNIIKNTTRKKNWIKAAIAAQAAWKIRTIRCNITIVFLCSMFNSYVDRIILLFVCF